MILYDIWRRRICFVLIVMFAMFFFNQFPRLISVETLSKAALFQYCKPLS